MNPSTDDRDNGGESFDEATREGAGGSAQALLFHRQLLARRLHIQSLVRFVVAGAVALGAVAARYVLDVEDLDVPALLALAGVVALFNVGAFAAAQRFRHGAPGEEPYRFLQGLMHLTISADFIFLTVGLAYVGGAKSPFQAFYLLHVMLAAVLLSPRSAYLHAFCGYAMFAALVVGQWTGVVPVQVPAGVVNTGAPLQGPFAITVLLVQGFLFALTSFLVTGLAQLLRQGEDELSAANAELSRISEMLRGFLRITLHDLRAPIAAATMLARTLELSATDRLDDKQRSLLHRIGVRLDEVTAFLRDFQMLSSLDRIDPLTQGEVVDVAGLLRRVSDENQDLAQVHGHHLAVETDGALPRVHGIDRLLHEAVTNLVTNAIKYTPDGGHITVRAGAEGDHVRVEVEDEGIGISPEDRKRLFQEFVRLRRKDEPTAAAKGTGLGLSIVKRIVDAHGGVVGVDITPGVGSTFYIELPTGGR